MIYDVVLMIMILSIKRYLCKYTKLISSMVISILSAIFLQLYVFKTLIILLFVSLIHSLSNFLNVDVPVPNVVTDKYFIATLRWNFLSSEIWLMQLLYESSSSSWVVFWVCNECSEKYKISKSILAHFFSCITRLIKSFEFLN